MDLNKNIKFEDFSDFINSSDPLNVFMGFTMMKSGLPLKSMSIDELIDIDVKIRHWNYKYPSNYSLIDYTIYWKAINIKCKILTKINNCKQKLEKIQRNENRNKY